MIAQAEIITSYCGFVAHINICTNNSTEKGRVSNGAIRVQNFLFLSPKTTLIESRSSLVAQTLKRLSTMWETRVRALGREVPWRRKWQSTPVLLPGKSHGQRSLIGYSLWSRRVGHDWATSLSLSWSIEEAYCNHWCWERLKVKGEEDGREWDGYIVSLTQRTWIWGTLRDGGGQRSLACCSSRDH